VGSLDGIHWKDLEAVILEHGFTFDRQRGDHRAYIRQGTLRPIIIPTWDELPEFIIRNGLRTAGISKKTFLQFLGR
jgi:predicted RNA binding protein YcfA (HicA-like mRNA interferase family)